MTQLVIADVTLSPPKLIKHVGASISNGGAFLLMPTTKSYLEQHGLGTNETAYRVTFSIPTSDGPPPSHPSLEYLQKHIDLKGPYEMSSNPAVTSQPVTVSKVIWSSRYKTASAIADRFFSVVPGESGHDGGAIMLVGDAAHIHSPVGGQGMNLGLRDAVGLGEKLAEHIKFAVDVNDYKILERYTSERHSRAEKVIGLTKGLNRLLGTFSGGRFFNLSFYFAAFIANLPIIGTMLNRLIAWRLSGLENA
jgi:2-polyprenyl-6-methoxyphenol hydroxylase-like FAD-dependent oxidoreductase